LFATLKQCSSIQEGKIRSTTNGRIDLTKGGGETEKERILRGRPVYLKGGGEEGPNHVTGKARNKKGKSGKHEGPEVPGRSVSYNLIATLDWNKKGPIWGF